MAQTPPPDGPPAARSLRARLRAIPEAAWAPLAGSALMVLPAALGLAAGRPWLFPSLGPTVFVHVHHPGQPSARLYNTVVGHALGVGAALLAIAALGAAGEPSVMAAEHLGPRRAWASVLAVVLTLFFQELLGAQHAPAAATTLLLTLGAFNADLPDCATIAVGVLLVAVPGQFVRRLRVGRPGRG